MISYINFRNIKGEIDTMYISARIYDRTVYIENHWFFFEIGFCGLKMCTEISPDEYDVDKNGSLVIKGVDEIC